MGLKSNRKEESPMRRKNARIYQLSHTTYCCQYHLVWGTKYRQKLFEKEYNKQVLKKILASICKWKGIEIHAWHVGEEHVHMNVTIPPKYSVSYAVNILKGKSSGWIKKKSKKFPMDSIWSRGYFVSTLGLNEEGVKRYIENHGNRFKDLQLELDLS